LSAEDQFALLQWCPELETFEWRPHQYFLPPRENTIQIQGLRRGLASLARQCPKLVRFRSLYKIAEEEDALLPFLESRMTTAAIKTTTTTTTVDQFRPLEELSLHQNWLGEASWHILREHHASTLRSLTLAHGPEITGVMIQDMLCHLYNLESFSAQLIQDVDLIDDPRPWVCNRLVHLRIGFEVVVRAGLEEEEEEGERTIFERLGTLAALETLHLFKVYAHFRPQDSIPGRTLNFRLDNGLDHLRSLRRLKELTFANFRQSLTEKDVVWMLEHWPRLEYVYGMLHPIRDVDESLRMILNSGNVKEQSPASQVASTFLIDKEGKEGGN
jgi:hypothetical protein